MMDHDIQFRSIHKNVKKLFAVKFIVLIKKSSWFTIEKIIAIK